MSGFDVTDSNRSRMAGATNPLANVTVEHLPNAAVVTVAGEIDMAAAPALENAVQQCLAQRPAKLVVDLTKASFFSSAGMAVLMMAQHSGGEVALHVVADERVVLRPLELTGLIDDLTIHDTLRAALDD